MSALTSPLMTPLMTQARTRVPRLAEAAVERARLTVVPRSTGRAARAPFVTLVSVLLVAGIAGLLLFNTQMQGRSLTATSLEQTATDLQAREQSLQMQLAEMRDPQRVAERAQALHMVPASSPAFIRLSDGKVLGNPKPASADDAVRITQLPARMPKKLRPSPVIAPMATSLDAAATAASATAHKAAHKTAHKTAQKTAGAHRGAAAGKHGAGAGTKNHGTQQNH